MSSLQQHMREGHPMAWVGWRPQRFTLDQILDAWEKALSQKGQPGFPATLQVYTHSAFCQTKCRYCKYWSKLPKNDEHLESYVTHLESLLSRYREQLGKVEAANAYHGGGTPTVLPAPLLKRYLEAFRSTFDIGSEFTCEANPSTLDGEKIRLLQKAGVNRLSLGIQSLDPVIQKVIGRFNPPPERIQELVRIGRAAGFHVNSDLVLGLPQQTAASFKRDLHRLIDMGPDSITVYRYLSVDRLPGDPGNEMRYSRIFTWQEMLYALRNGYLAMVGADDSVYAILLFKLSPRVALLGYDLATYVAQRVVSHDVPYPRYQFYESLESHLLGIGPGATSHIYGFGWFRDVTSLDFQADYERPIYWGSRLDKVDEARTALLNRLSRNQWIDLRAINERSSIKIEQHLKNEIKEAFLNRTVVRRFSQIKLNPKAPKSEQETFIDNLLPQRIDEIENTARQAVELKQLQESGEVEPELIDTDLYQHLSTSEDGQRILDRLEQKPPALLLVEWIEHVGLPAEPGPFEDAVIETYQGNRAIIRLEPAPALPLAIIVEKTKEQLCFCRSGKFAISYQSAPGHTLTPREERFLRMLCKKMAG